MKYYTKEGERYLAHHGVKGQKWGERNGPPYPIKRDSNGNPISRKTFKKTDTIVLDAIKNGEVIVTMNAEKQAKHLRKNAIKDGRSYVYGNLDRAEKLIQKLYGTGEPILTKEGKWAKMERVENDSIIGVYPDNPKVKTNKAMIRYSNTGTHIHPRNPYGKKKESD